MKEHGILFKAEMVRAILAGKKTQTRRIVKQPESICAAEFANAIESMQRLGVCDVVRRGPCDGIAARLRCPYGKPGDRLWVRETWRPTVAHHCACDACDCADVNVTYAADGEVYFFDEVRIDELGGGSWLLPKAARTGNVSPLFMPRWATRIVLDVTTTRIERLHDISEADAIAEGLKSVSKDGSLYKWGIPDRDGLPGTDDSGWPWHEWEADPRRAYAKLWERINGPGSWDVNPWVWVVTFAKVAP